MNPDKIMRKELLALLKGGQAHIGFRRCRFGFSSGGDKPPCAQWQLPCVARFGAYGITQWDILEFVRNSHHVSPEFPNGYWPEPGAKATAPQWNQIIKGIRSD